MGRRLGVMGGTFDPIHHGHLLTAEEAFWHYELDEVVFMPTGRSWMKEHEVSAPAEDRYRMTVIGTGPNPHFSVSRAEIERDGPTHTVDTLRALHEGECDDCDLYFITGADAMLEFAAWKEPDEVLRLAHVIAATRPGYDLAAVRREQNEGVSVMEIPALAISSTDIRRRVAEGRPIRYLVPDGVQAYIEEANLYR